MIILAVFHVFFQIFIISTSLLLAGMLLNHAYITLSK